MTKVNVERLTRAAKDYVTRSVDKANGNSNKMLSLAEAKKLPADLRDNYKNFKAATGASTVDAEAFKKSFAAYAARTIEKAADGKSVLTDTEIQKLPKDLRDNVINFAQATKSSDKAPDAKWLTALKDDVEEKLFDGDLDDKGVSRSTLPATLKVEYDRLFEEDGFGEYEPTAYPLDFQGQKAWAIVTTNDGGMTLNLYDKAGKNIANGSAGESTDFGWN